MKIKNIYNDIISNYDYKILHMMSIMEKYKLRMLNSNIMVF